MKLIAKSHIISAADIKKITGLGYIINKNSILDFNTFINKYFSNFNILQFIEVLETSFATTFSANVDRKIIYDDNDCSIVIEIDSNSGRYPDCTYFVRQFIRNGNTIKIDHKYCIIPPAFQGKRLITPVFKESLQQYINMNASKIAVHAALEGGGYTWAKYGFVAVKRNEINSILSKAKRSLTAEQFTFVNDIYTNYYGKNQKGRSFPINSWALLDYMKPILRGSNWYGELNLRSKKQLNKFIEYVYR